MRLVKIVFIFIAFTLISEFEVAAANSSYISIVNPIRIAPYTSDSSKIISEQYEIVRSYNYPATWLLTYDAIRSEEVNSELEKFDQNQELGIFLEISKELADEVGVTYNDNVAWHYPNNVFLSGYNQDERRLLIDKIFETFKDKYGSFPVSVGSWWTDSYSLSYMKDKYGIQANLTCSDQYKTDNYQLWGQYFSSPYYPSYIHSGIPGEMDIVMVQWASRDPLNGYYNSLYSTQDYHVGEVNLDIKYFEKLIRTYLLEQENSTSHIVVGLESDLSPGAYKGGEFDKQIGVVSSLEEEGVRVVTMKDYSDYFMSNYDKSPVFFINSKDLVGSRKTTYWYNSPNYRIGIHYDESNYDIEIFDLRKYSPHIFEPHYSSPNEQLSLSINIPSYVDEISNPKSVSELNLGEIKGVERDNDQVKILFSEGEIMLLPNKVEISGDMEKLNIEGWDTVILKRSDRYISLQFDDNWLTTLEEVNYYDLTREATFFIKRKLFKVIVLSTIILFFAVVFLSYKYFKFSKKTLIFILIYLLTVLGTYQFWLHRNSITYAIHQEEISALNYLKNLPDGNILVYDNTCLGCVWYSEYKPAVFDNKRDYVKKFTKKNVVYSKDIFEAKSQEEARDLFNKSKTTYIYVVTYGSYSEHPPFSPGDLNIERIFKNAHVEIWRAKDT